VQVGKNADFDLIGIDTPLAEFVRAVEAVFFLAGVMVFGRTLGIGQTGIDHDLVLTRINVKAQYRDLDLFSGLALEEHVGAQIRLAPARIDGINLGILY
jgi:hypothetical protein